jgi:hypothetical protein
MWFPKQCSVFIPAVKKGKMAVFLVALIKLQSQLSRDPYVVGGASTQLQDSKKGEPKKRRAEPKRKQIKYCACSSCSFLVDRSFSDAGLAHMQTLGCVYFCHGRRLPPVGWLISSIGSSCRTRTSTGRCSTVGNLSDDWTLFDATR